MSRTVLHVADPQGWLERLSPLLPDEHLLLPDEALEVVDEVTVAVVEGTAEGLDRYPNLAFAQSLWAGVDKLVPDQRLGPNVTLARMVNASFAQSMAEFVTASVLYVHRRFPTYLAQQSKGIWAEHSQPVAQQCAVAVLGAGELGARSAAMLRTIGFPVRCWARRERPGDHTVLSGTDGLSELLRTAAVIVNLLPLTTETERIIDDEFLAQCQFATVIINAGRGRHIDDEALLRALDTGHVGHAILDVFTIEPLPVSHRYWTHLGVTLMPHVATISTPETVAETVAFGLRAYRSGSVIPNCVDRMRGY